MQRGEHQGLLPEDAFERKAMGYARSIAKALGSRLYKDTDVIARALMLLDSRLPRMLMEAECWFDDLCEHVGTMRDEIDGAEELLSRWDGAEGY